MTGIINLSTLVLHFTIFSFIGWVCETILCSILHKRFVNRGFLRSPICPIYGFGGLLVLLTAAPLAQWPPLVFLVSVAVTSTLEYFTSWLLEALFQIRWWDYSNSRFNLNGRVCLLNSLAFGVMGLGAVYGVFPLVDSALANLSWNTLRLLATGISVIIFLDTISTISSLVNLSDRLHQLQNVFAEMAQYELQENWFDRNDLGGSIARLREICKEDEENESARLILRQFDNLDNLKNAGARLLNSFPKLRPTKGMTEAISHLRSRLDESREQIERGRRFNKRVINAIKAALLDARQSAKAGLHILTHPKGLCILLWTFVIASFLGFCGEALFSFIRYGVLEPRQGLLYGPFSPIYGVGAVLIVITLSPWAKKQSWATVFMGGAFVGGAYEFLASVVQETLFGTYSWDYSSLDLSVFKRTHPVYMIFWGLLALQFLRHVYPKILSVISRMEKRPLMTLTVVLGVLITCDSILTIAALSRWQERHEGVLADSAVEHFLDSYYSDEYLENTFPNMKFID